MRLLALTSLVLLSACSGKDGADDPDSRRDPVVAAALDDPLMTDPDLVSQNRGNAALHGGLPDGALPPFKRSQEEVTAARTQAERMLGRPVSPAPEPAATASKSRLSEAVTLSAIAKAAGLGGNCADQLQYGFVWAARLPVPLPVYPRGHTLVAGGNDQAGCKLRAVRFVTPVSPAEVIAFYYASAGAAKLPVRHTREGDDDVVAGNDYALFARKRADGLTEVDLVTAGP